MAAKKVSKSDKRIQFLTELGVKFSKELTLNATQYELKLYRHLKDLHYKFEFQVPVICSKKHLYILDFLLPEYKLVIEADSKLHHGSKEDRKKDNLRSRRLIKEGYTILRLWNKQISTFTKETIHQIIQSRINQIVKS